MGEEAPGTSPCLAAILCSEEEGRGLFQAALAAGPALVVGGVYENAQMFMRDCQLVIYESLGLSPIKAVPSMF